MEQDAVDLVGLARIAMRERGLEPEFPPEVLEQVARLDGPLDDASLADLRHLAWCSIDNDDSRDLDQLSVAEGTSRGTRVRVAIADVDAFVPHGTPVDQHAGINTTSVYTPMHVFPMLPERLSTDLTSLNPDADRIAVVLAFDVDAEGTVSGGTVERALVRNQARLSYDDVAAWLEARGPAPPPIASREGMADQVRLQDEAAAWLRVRRHRDGALDFQGSEARAVVADGHVVGLKKEEKNRAQALIEDFMIAVNGVSARFLEERGVPSIRRVVRTPKRWDRLQVIAQDAGRTPAGRARCPPHSRHSWPDGAPPIRTATACCHSRCSSCSAVGNTCSRDLATRTPGTSGSRCTNTCTRRPPTGAIPIWSRNGC